MRYLQTTVERGIKQSPRAATFQYWSNWAFMLAGAVFMIAGTMQAFTSVALFGAVIMILGLVGLLRAEVYAIARLLVAAAKT